jgi:hypothetical protein
MGFRKKSTKFSTWMIRIVDLWGITKAPFAGAVVRFTLATQWVAAGLGATGLGAAGFGAVAAG